MQDASPSIEYYSEIEEEGEAEQEEQEEEMEVAEHSALIQADSKSKQDDLTLTEKLELRGETEVSTRFNEDSILCQIERMENLKKKNEL